MMERRQIELFLRGGGLHQFRSRHHSYGPGWLVITLAVIGGVALGWFMSCVGVPP